MNYHTITYPDQNNGDGLRVVLWLSGCNHHCYNCQNPQTWDANSGIPFDESAKEELFGELNKDYISGLTLTGGDPLHEANLDEVLNLVNEIRLLFGDTKTVWLYTGYTWESIMEYVTPFKNVMDTPNDEILYDYHMWKRRQIIEQCNVLIDGKYIDSQRDITLPYRGSKNQRLIDIQKSFQRGETVLWQT